MDKDQIKITSSCVIDDNKVFKDDQLVFEGKAVRAADFLVELYNYIAPDYPKFYKMDNLSKLGWLAAEILLKNSFDRAACKAEETGVVLSNSNSSLDTDRRYFQTISEYPSPSLFVYTLPNIVIGEICIRNQFQGENAFFVFDGFQPDFLEQYVTGLIKNGTVRTCICGWVDILADNYKAALYLVREDQKGIVFAADNLSRLFRGSPETKSQ